MKPFTLPFTKVVRLGTKYTGEERFYSVFCKINLKEGGNLSITGVEGPLLSGNAIGSCGQIVMSLSPDSFDTFAPGWDAEKVNKFLEVWERWHLNDMKAGSPAQEEFLRNHPDRNNHRASYYDWACEVLKKADLYPDPETGYKYGSAWLHEDVPEDVLEFLYNLPETDKKPAWI